jgi:hypothetical protein
MLVVLIESRIFGIQRIVVEDVMAYDLWIGNNKMVSRGTPLPCRCERTFNLPDGPFHGRVSIRQQNDDGRIVGVDVFALQGVVQRPSSVPALIISLDVDVEGIYRVRFSNAPRREHVRFLRVGGVARMDREELASASLRSRALELTFRQFRKHLGPLLALLPDDLLRIVANYIRLDLGCT